MKDFIFEDADLAKMAANWSAKDRQKAARKFRGWACQLEASVRAGASLLFGFAMLPMGSEKIFWRLSPDERLELADELQERVEYLRLSADLMNGRALVEKARN